MLTRTGPGARLRAMTQSNIYMDFNATTPVSALVKEKLGEWVELWGNPSSIHAHGRGPKRILRESRRGMAQVFGCHPLELVFTGGGSEANNLAIQGCLRELKNKQPQRNKVILGGIEHPSVLKQKDYLQSLGYEVLEIPVSREGSYDLNFYKEILNEKVSLVSVMLANNELGIIAPIAQMVEWAHQVGAYFHSDCVQAFGKIPMDLKSLNVDLASFSSHKLYALKGSGLLYVKKGTPLSPIIYGGAQERYRRAGTENLLSIASFALMVEKADGEEFKEKISVLRDQMEAQLLTSIDGLEVICKNSERLPNTSALFVPGVSAESMLMNLDIRGFSVGTGAACSSGNPEPSPVLLSIGLTREEAQSSLRISLGQSTTGEQIQAFVKTFAEVVEHLRRLGSDGEIRERV